MTRTAAGSRAAALAVVGLLGFAALPAQAQETPTSPVGWSIDGVGHVNADGTADVGLSVTVFIAPTSYGTCSFSDADNLANTDSTDAFTVKQTSLTIAAVVYCTLTLID